MRVLCALRIEMSIAAVLCAALCLQFPSRWLGCPWDWMVLTANDWAMVGIMFGVELHHPQSELHQSQTWRMQFEADSINVGRGYRALRVHA